MKACAYTRVSKYKGEAVILCSCVERRTNMDEKYIERKFTEAVKKKGGLALKFVSPGTDGVPDRIVLFPMGRIAFVELKSPGQKMRPLQMRRKSQLERLGFKVFCIDGAGQIGGVIDEIKGMG